MAALLIATGQELCRCERDGDGGWTTDRVLEDSGAQCVARDPLKPDRVLVGTRGDGAHLSVDGGVSFERVAIGEDDVFAVAISQADGRMYVGTEPSRLFRSDDGHSWEELEALQQIPSRPQWSFPPRPWTSHVRWIAPHPKEADRILVGIELGGVMLTTDGGRSFSDHREGAVADVHALAWHPSGEVAYEAAGGGAAWSADLGETWARLPRGLHHDYVWALACDPAEPSQWFVSATDGPRSAHGDGEAGASVYRWSGEGPWEEMATAIPAMPYALAVAGGAVWAGLADGRVLRSEDVGESWQDTGIRAPGLVAFAVGARQA
ncbi:MAG: WD40/YVTN/BNR-like repeat-containing protein [Solirubrobacterales bacterium]